MSERNLTPQQWKRRKFISFGLLGLFGVGVYGVQRWISGAPDKAQVKGPLRDALEFNARLNSALKDDDHMAPEFPKERAVKKPRVNGHYGVKTPIDLATWTLQIITDQPAPHVITLDRIKALPKTEVCFDFKCIEGWSEISHWGGVRFSEFARHFALGTKSGSEDLFAYMGLRTPDGAYYVGIDMKSALHPQTILAYEMNGAPLPEDQGAPLRLIIPTKYGVKNLKRIGTMYFSDERPPDYWAERGYDYDGAL